MAHDQTSDRPFDCIVLGTGGAGSAALYHLARRGARVLGIDRFPDAHDRGSSHGDTRIIRQAYFEHFDYVPLLERAYELWAELEERSGKKLYRETGLIEIGPPDGEVVPGVLESARRFDLEIERIDPREVERRFEGFLVPDGLEAVFERRAGYLHVEECVRTHLEEARKLGAETLVGEAITGWKVEGDSVTVTTERSTHRAGRLVITPGAWAPDLLADAGVRFRVLRKSLFWYAARTASYRDAPCFLYELPAERVGDEHRVFYGFPDIEPHGIKVAEHTGGQPVEDPLTVDRDVLAEDREAVESFLAGYMPQVSDECRKHVVCLYTMSPDTRYIVDRHPRHEQVVFAAGLSGHGFKLTATIGEVLADLALEGSTKLPIGFLSLERFDL